MQRMAHRQTTPRTRNTDLHVVFDFYKSDPQGAALNGQVHPGKEHGGSRRLYWNSVQSVRENEQFLEGMLLRSLEKGDKYPFVQYIVYSNRAMTQPRRRTELTNGTAYCPQLPPYNQRLVEIVASQGGYREMFTFVDHQTALLPKRPQNPHAAYVISAFKVRGPTHDLDKTWSYWSGADLIVESAPKYLKLNRVTFHKVKYDHSLDTFAYVLMCELSEALAFPSRALEFVSTLKDRQCGVTSLYAIEHLF